MTRSSRYRRAALSRLDDAGRRSGCQGVRGTVRARQIGLRTHLDQSRGGALEFGSLETLVRLIERIGFGRGGGDKLDVHVVERVDQNDEALGGVAVVVSHHRNVVED